MRCDVSCELQSKLLQGGYIGGIIGEYYRGSSGHVRSLDNGSCLLQVKLLLAHVRSIIRSRFATLSGTSTMQKSITPSSVPSVGDGAVCKSGLYVRLPTATIARPQRLWPRLSGQGTSSIIDYIILYFSLI